MEGQNDKLTFQGVRRQTPQREQILEIVERAKGPLTAPEIYRIARKARPKIGLATIYRTLKLMQEENRVRLVVLPDGITRFERMGFGQHHFQCRICQRVWTITHNFPELLASFSWSNGFVIENHDSTFYGRCPKCKDAAQLRK